jgi:hypothetical protein
MNVKLFSETNDNTANEDRIKNLKIHNDEVNKIVSKKNIHKKIQI